MSVSMRVMSAGDGYRYLLRSVAAGDGNRAVSTPLTRYYSEAGTPPGRWMGSGLSRLGAGGVAAGGQISEAQLALLIGMGRNPVTGDPLGRAYPRYKPLVERIQDRVRDLDPSLDRDDCAAETARIEAQESAVGVRRAVAGFDFTFSVPKSVSALWAVADANTQEMLVAVHHVAVAEVLDYLEREVAATRTGVSNGNGAVAQVPVHGVIAAAYDHWDSRANDPQLHTHLVVSNKVKAVLDGRWRSLDGRPIHAAVTALSAHYNAVLADRLTGTLGVGWELRARGKDRNPQWEIAGAPEGLIRAFSSRTKAIEEAKDDLIAEYVARHGRHPSPATVIKLRAQATLATRPDKHVHYLADLTARWRATAGGVLGEDPTEWARRLVTGASSDVVRPEAVTPEIAAALGAALVEAVGEKRSTWRHWNLWAEASRQTMGWRFATAADREVVVGRIVEAAKVGSVPLTPGEQAVSPVEFQREDGTTVFRPRHATVYSSTTALDAEARMLARADDLTAPRLAKEKTIKRPGRGLSRRIRPSAEQMSAVESIATSGRRIDLLVGPAGAGKTTTMRALREAWEHNHGRRSVIGLAPSAAAAQVLAEDLGIVCENTAKWLHDRHTFQPDQFVIIDEATLADTKTLDRITAQAEHAGAKILLVGDPAQLDAVDAGGAFALLAGRRDDVPTLTEIHRFTHAWEKTVSLHLRDGKPEAITAYATHGRLHDGTTEEILEQAYAAWRTDQQQGHTSLLIAQSAETVRALNTRARAERILAGEITPTRETTLADGTHATAGDRIVTHRNDRTLTTSTGDWVRNGAHWQVERVKKDGGLLVRDASVRGASVTLPAAYVAKHVELGYAVTAHRAQGLTVDTAHVLASAKTTRESLYVALTRGRDANHAYVALDTPDETHAPPEPDDANAQTVLHGVLRRTGVELSACQMVEAERETWGNIAQLAAEYDTLAAAAQHDRWTTLIHRSGLTPAQAEQVLASNAFGPLTAALRRAEATCHDIDTVFPEVVRRRNLTDADDLAAVLLHRLDLATAGRGMGASHLIAGLIPEARGPIPEPLRTALDQRRDLIDARARHLANEAVRRPPPWLRRLGSPPSDPVRRTRWLTEVLTIVAYRDRYQIDSDLAFGAGAPSGAQQADASYAQAAYRRAARILAEQEHLEYGLSRGPAPER